MNLETHPAMHYIAVMAFYYVGLLMNVLVAAHLSTASKNNAVMSFRQYLAYRWMPLTVRWTVCTFIFLIGWENPAFNLERFMPTLATHLGVAGLLGFASDEFTSKVLALVGIQKELPPVPTADNGTKPS